MAASRQETFQPIFSDFCRPAVMDSAPNFIVRHEAHLPVPPT
jgi:hypothetical protein